MNTLSEPPDPLISGLKAKFTPKYANQVIREQIAQLSTIIPEFFIALMRRLYAYLQVSVRLLQRMLTFVIGGGVRLKKYCIRLLMYRGGIFYQSPRFGLYALMSSTAVAIIIIPAIQPVTDAYSLNQIMSQSKKIVNEDIAVLAAMPKIGADSSVKGIRTEVLQHQVASGETLSTIAEMYLVSIEGLKYVNNMSSDLIHPGDELTIPPVDGLIHIVEGGDTLSSVAEKYNVPTQAIADFNYLEEPFTLHAGVELIIPDAEIPRPEPIYPQYAQYAHATQPAGLVLETTQVGTGGFIMPTHATLSQYFWWGHTAIDLANSCGTPVVAADSGTIAFAGWWAGGGGYSIFIDHGNGYRTRYAHLSSFARTGGAVQRGDVIGYIGSTGRSTGCHLHFMVIRNGIPVDPLAVL